MAGLVLVKPGPINCYAGLPQTAGGFQHAVERGLGRFGVSQRTNNDLRGVGVLAHGGAEGAAGANFQINAPRCFLQGANGLAKAHRLA